MQRAIVDNRALFPGMLMVTNGLLVTLLSIRGAGLDVTPLTISIMQACYILVALIGTIALPHLIEKAGHIRVISALASTDLIAAPWFSCCSSGRCSECYRAPRHHGAGRARHAAKD